MNIVPRANNFGAVITDVDLSRRLQQDVLSALNEAFARYGVLSFSGQTLDPAGLQAFSAQLGNFGEDPFVAPMADYPHVIEVRREATETAPIFGSMWHSDWSFQRTPPSATVLYGAVVPPVGGDTVFADTERACAALSPTLQDMLKGLNAIHSAAPAYGPSGLFSRDDHTRSMQIIVSPEAENTERHPVLRRHPVTARTVLFINHVYTVAIEGLHADESKALLEFLFKHLTRDEFVYRHRWQPGSLLMWDNRRVVHYADGGYEGHQRLMYRTTIAGDEPARATMAA